MFNTILFIGDFILFLSGIFTLLVSFFISCQTRFVQIRKIPEMFRLLVKKKKEGEKTLDARHALFTAMSTTLGISTIVSPVIAIHMGGPGVIVGFLLATFLGAGINYAEVTAALAHRFKKEGRIIGGPMGYIGFVFSPFWAKWYAFFAAIMLLVWTSAQANQLAEMLASPLLGDFVIPKWITGILLGALVVKTLFGGIKRIGSYSAALVPVMFTLYVGACLWIIVSNSSFLMHQLADVFLTFWRPKTFVTGAAVGGIVSAMRWGVMKCLHGSEAGVGTQTIPHSLAEVQNPQKQGILAMVSTYSAGLILILSSFVALITESWLHTSLPVGISMVAFSFKLYFAELGLVIVVLSVILFAFGTILGNSFNGSQCYLYLFSRRYLNYFYCSVAFIVFFGAVSDVKLIWSLVDYALVFILLPNVSSLVVLAIKHPTIFSQQDQMSVTTYSQIS
jgi:alanine or glycine:cation symporter, AGCS family